MEAQQRESRTGSSEGRTHRHHAASLVNRIFLALLAVSVVAVVLAGLASTVVYQGSVQDDAQAQLAREANMLSQVLDRNVAVTSEELGDGSAGTPAVGADDVSAEDEASVLGALDLGDLRATLVDDDGTVLYDSETDAAELPNHADRPEIASAFATGTGTIVRSSNTVGNVSIYYAVRLNSGHVLRLALDRAGVVALLRRDTGMLFLVALALVVLSWIVAHTLSRRLIRPVINMYPALQPDTVHAAKVLGNSRDAASFEDADRLARSEQAPEEHREKEQGKGEPGPSSPDSGVRETLGGAREKPLVPMVRVVSPYRELEPLTNRINSQQERLLNQMNQLEEANLMRIEFTANVTHELKTPLQSISGASELMAEGMVEPEDIPDFARRIYSEARRLTNLVNDILTLSKLDDVERSGTSVYHETTEPVDLFAVARDVEQRLASKANDSEVELTLDGSHVVIHGLPRLLDELVYNLVDNAIRYNRPDGYVRVWVGVVAGCPTLRVSDTGIGIAPADHEKIFERFYRVEKSRSRASGGTGLGLAIVKHAAAYHHATVEVSSELGKGSTFTVTFPRGL